MKQVLIQKWGTTKKDINLSFWSTRVRILFSAIRSTTKFHLVFLASQTLLFLISQCDSVDKTIWATRGIQFSNSDIFCNFCFRYSVESGPKARKHHARWLGISNHCRFRFLQTPCQGTDKFLGQVWILSRNQVTSDSDRQRRRCGLFLDILFQPFSSSSDDEWDLYICTKRVNRSRSSSKGTFEQHRYIFVKRK